MTISLVTPLRDEIANLPSLFSAVANLNVTIDDWVICENGSTDGSREFLSSHEKPETVRNLHVLNLDTETAEYQLGFKYSRIVLHGMNHIFLSNDNNSEFIGILDADCFPSPDYYNALLEAFLQRPDLGIVSGSLVNTDGARLPAAKGFPRGNSRLWRRQCLIDAPYMVGMSADTLSAIRAEIKGWKSDALTDAIVVTREVGMRAGPEYYGASAYYRGETLTFTLAKSISKLISNPRYGLGYLSGYVSAMKQQAPQVQDPEILAYSKRKLWKFLRT